MKKPLFQRRRVLLSTSTRNSILGVVGLVLIILIFRFALPNTFFGVTTGLMNTGTGLTNSLSGLFAVFSDRAELVRKIQTLEHERDVLYEETVLQKNALLSVQIAPEDLQVSNAVRVAVGARPPVSPYDTLMLLSGSADGVSHNDIVYSEAGIPLGAVDTVSGRSARAVLYSEAGRVTTGYIGVDKILVDIVGRGAGAYTAVVSNDVDISVGDTVSIAAPDMRPMGRVSKVETSASNPETIVSIQAYTNIFTLSHVLVGRGEE